MKIKKIFLVSGLTLGFTTATVVASTQFFQYKENNSVLVKFVNSKQQEIASISLRKGEKLDISQILNNQAIKNEQKRINQKEKTEYELSFEQSVAIDDYNNPNPLVSNKPIENDMTIILRFVPVKSFAVNIELNFDRFFNNLNQLEEAHEKDIISKEINRVISTSKIIKESIINDLRFTWHGNKIIFDTKPILKENLNDLGLTPGTDPNHFSNINKNKLIKKLELDKLNKIDIDGKYSYRLFNNTNETTVPFKHASSSNEKASVNLKLNFKRSIKVEFNVKKDKNSLPITNNSKDVFVDEIIAKNNTFLKEKEEIYKFENWNKSISSEYLNKFYKWEVNYFTKNKANKQHIQYSLFGINDNSSWNTLNSNTLNEINFGDLGLIGNDISNNKFLYNISFTCIADTEYKQVQFDNPDKLKPLLISLNSAPTQKDAIKNAILSSETNIQPTVNGTKYANYWEYISKSLKLINNDSKIFNFSRWNKSEVFNKFVENIQDAFKNNSTVVYKKIQTPLTIMFSIDKNNIDNVEGIKNKNIVFTIEDDGTENNKVHTIIKLIKDFNSISNPTSTEKTNYIKKIKEILEFDKKFFGENTEYKKEVELIDLPLFTTDDNSSSIHWNFKLFEKILFNDDLGQNIYEIKTDLTDDEQLNGHEILNNVLAKIGKTNSLENREFYVLRSGSGKSIININTGNDFKSQVQNNEIFIDKNILSPIKFYYGPNETDYWTFYLPKKTNGAQFADDDFEIIREWMNNGYLNNPFKQIKDKIKTTEFAKFYGLNLKNITDKDFFKILTTKDFSKKTININELQISINNKISAVDSNLFAYKIIPSKSALLTLNNVQYNIFDKYLNLNLVLDKLENEIKQLIKTFNTKVFENWMSSEYPLKTLFYDETSNLLISLVKEDVIKKLSSIVFLDKYNSHLQDFEKGIMFKDSKTSLDIRISDKNIEKFINSAIRGSSKYKYQFKPSFKATFDVYRNTGNSTNPNFVNNFSKKIYVNSAIAAFLHEECLDNKGQKFSKNNSDIEKLLIDSWKSNDIKNCLFYKDSHADADAAQKINIANGINSSDKYYYEIDLNKFVTVENGGKFTTFIENEGHQYVLIDDKNNLYIQIK
ncbi:hypothetical protein [Mycoplasma sp. Mirounga ES2805-ORL]|uniref:hypothetical protein n=1 Tax=Mycoplasma sp. Mirounga ES2805-ORL TaxID=754514 RepID=UPI00197B7D42|nr:hypothetical protein [Mycoplasma sp. Mirounga ES2805-ORL]QSF13826.1 hypothetical protein JXZ90_00800 [Mycoplasma sp. Mirounga ES2805-ORL]